MTRVAVDAVGPAGSEIRLAERESHHLLIVRRHRRGHPLVVFDPQGRQARATLVRVEAGHAVLEIGDPIAGVPVVGTPLHLILGIPKGPSLEHALRMAVEVGVTHVHPVSTAYSVRRADRGDRWGRILASACAQCGRASPPILSPLSPLDAAIEDLPSDLDRYVAAPGAPRIAGSTRPAVLLVGPEGGLAPAEVQRCTDTGWRPLGLGPRILRTDTAVAVGLAILRYIPEGTEE